MSHVVLLGDSIFDNGVYVAPGPDVIRQLRSLLPQDWTATLLAVDGHVTSDVLDRQLPRLPRDADYLVLSVGGNDALGQSSILAQPATSVADAVAMLDRARSRFRDDYRRLLNALADTGIRTAVCTIYDAAYAPPQGPIVAAALSLFNDIITRAAFERGFDLIDLRLICDQIEDYANPIEPSVAGGTKIASAIEASCRGTADAMSRVWLHAAGRMAMRPTR